jgi:hypothetical protein
MPVAEINFDLPIVLARVCFDGVSGPLGLLARAGVEEHALTVPGDDDAIVKRHAQVMLEVLGSKALGHRSGMVLLTQVDLQPPIVVHR